ncbi:hypothetical protein IQ07DRAFT_649331 [Pyrenochaeta sp. DS3sAY3a]|nr:hypothetical protein IQ07DRAFT_649331 [Pyrenochaeta sp. DS3sAY3a]
MQPFLLFIFALGQGALAAKWAFDSACTALLLNDGSTIDATRGISRAVNEAIEMADNAFQVMDRLANDVNVQQILNIFLDNDLVKVAQVKATFGAIRIFDRSPSSLAVGDPQWQLEKTNQDVEFYCDLKRYTRHPTLDTQVIDTSMEGTRWANSHYERFLKYYTLDYDLNGPQAKLPSMARTTDSDLLNRAILVSDRLAGLTVNERDPKYSTPRPHLPSAIDISTWWIHQWHLLDFPLTNSAFMELVVTEEFMTGFLAKNPGQRVPMDALRTFSMSMLHELTHTVPGGYLLDTPDTTLCYGWSNCVAYKNPRNAETVAMIGVAFWMLKLGYMPGEDGSIRPIQVSGHV